MHSYHFSPSASPRLNSIRFPAKGAVQLLTTLLVFFLSLCLFPTLATAQSPHIYVAPRSGPPGSQTSTVGNGWDPNATVDIYFDSTDVGLVDSDSNGSFGMALRAPTIRQNGLTIHIPEDAVPGQHWITAVERITQLQAQVAFTVKADWPQFRFDLSHTGYNPWEVALSPETVGNLVLDWRYNTGNFVTYSSPVVRNGVVYIGSWDYYLYALNAETGAFLWDYATRGPIESTPAVANGVVYVGSTEGLDSPDYSLYALNAATGAFLWKYTTGSFVASSPAVANGVVYVGSEDNNVYALDASTGALLWKYATGGIVYSSPAVANGVVYVGSGDYNVYALDASTGALGWKYITGDYVASSPAVANGVVYVGSNDYNVYALDASTGALVWKYITGNYVDSSPAVANGVVYVGSSDSNVYALNASTGTLLWKQTTGSAVPSSPAVANGVVYVASLDGNLYALNASTGALLWKYKVGANGGSSPAVANGVVYVGSADYDYNVYAFHLPDQQMSEKFSPPERPDPARLTPNWSLQPNTVVTPSKK